MKFDNCQMMDRKMAYAVEDVLPFIAEDKRSEDAKRFFHGDQVKMFSDRYKVFAKSTICSCCDLEGTFFVKERDLGLLKSGGPFHFNLYGHIDGQAVLMTKDHTIPKAKGGKNTLSNYETMCYPCNKLKGDTL